jgi:intein-encoded DNA endonuclease-like protein
MLILFKEGEINISKLSRLTNIRYDILKKELINLQNMGYIEIITQGRAKIIRLNFSNPKIIILMNLIEQLEKI